MSLLQAQHRKYAICLLQFIQCLWQRTGVRCVGEIAVQTTLNSLQYLVQRADQAGHRALGGTKMEYFQHPIVQGFDMLCLTRLAQPPRQLLATSV